MNCVRPLRFPALATGLVWALALGSCAQPVTGNPPPGVNGSAPALFFPTGMALSPDGTQLFVANSNYDRAFASGTVVRLPTATFDGLAGKTVPVPAETPVVPTDAFAGELRVNPAGDALYLTTRDHGLLTRIPLTNAGFGCPPQTGCRTGVVDLASAHMVDPFNIAFGTLLLPNAASAQPAVMVTHVTPETTGSGANAHDAFLAVMPEASVAGAGGSLTTGTALSNVTGAFQVDLGVPAPDSLIFDPTTRRLYLGGCYVRVDPQTVLPCQADQESSFSRANPVRIVLPEGGPGTVVSTVDLGPLLGGANTAAIALSSDKQSLYVATTTPSALLHVSLPQPGQTAPPTLLSQTPLALSPTRMIVLPRATGDLVVVSATQSNTVIVADPVRGQVLVQLDPQQGLGQGPFELASVPLPAPAGGDRVFVGLFNNCAVQAIDVPADAPFRAAVSGAVGPATSSQTLGTCP